MWKIFNRLRHEKNSCLQINNIENLSVVFVWPHNQRKEKRILSPESSEIISSCMKGKINDTLSARSTLDRRFYHFGQRNQTRPGKIQNVYCKWTNNVTKTVEPPKKHKQKIQLVPDQYLYMYLFFIKLTWGSNTEPAGHLVHYSLLIWSHMGIKGVLIPS